MPSQEPAATWRHRGSQLRPESLYISACRFYSRDVFVNKIEVIHILPIFGGDLFQISVALYLVALADKIP